MVKAKFILGIDPSADTFDVALISSNAPKGPIFSASFQNDIGGYSELISFLKSHKASIKKTLISIENTGVYNEKLAYFLYEKGYSITLVHPLAVAQSQSKSSHKTDKEDAIKVAMYSLRHLDELRSWQPSSEIVEKISQVLTARELITKEATALKNSLTSLKRKKNPFETVLQALEEMIDELENQKKHLEKTLEKLIKEGSPELQQHVSNLKSIPGVSLLMSCYFLVETGGFQKNLEYKKFSSYLGICPFKYESGSSIRKRAKSRGFGPRGMRRLLHLASRSVCTHQEKFKKYLQTKIAQGKDKMLIYNNVSNKLVKIMCSIVKSNSPYRDDYVSVNPILYK